MAFPIPISTTGRLYILPRPRGGGWLKQDIEDWKRRGINIVVSTLTEPEMRELELDQEAILIEESGLNFCHFPIADRGIPNSTDLFEQFVTALAESLKQGKNVGVHCRQGIGRSGLIAIAILQQFGHTFADARKTVSLARGVTVPETDQQTQWVKNLTEFAAA